MQPTLYFLLSRCFTSWLGAIDWLCSCSPRIAADQSRKECTTRYVARVASQFGGAWVCGLCAEAIKDEAARRGVGLEAAMRAHAEFVGSIAAGANADPTIQVAQALLQLLKRVIATTPTPSTPVPVLPPATAAAQDLDM